MPIFDSQYPVNSNPAGEDKILTTDTSDSSAVKSVTLTKVQEWIGSQTFTGPLNVDGDIYASDVIVSNSMWCISSSSSVSSGDFSSWTNKQTTPFITRSGSTFTVNKDGFYRIELYCAFTVSGAGTSVNNEWIRSLIRFDSNYANEEFVAGFAPILRSTITSSTIAIGLYLPENATFKAELLVSVGLSDPITIRAMNISATKV